MSAHVVELFWRWSCLFGKIAPLLGLSSGGGSGQDSGLAGKWGYRRNSSRSPAPPSQTGSLLGADKRVIHVARENYKVYTGSRQIRHCSPTPAERSVRKIKKITLWAHLKRKTQQAQLKIWMLRSTPTFPVTVWCRRRVQECRPSGPPWVDAPGWWSSNPSLHFMGSCLSSACAFIVSRAVAS